MTPAGASARNARRARTRAGTPDAQALATARRVLDRPLQFLLKTRGWALRHFSHESDLFSTWGLLVLEPGGHPAGGRAALLRAARAAGFSRGAPPDGDALPDLAAWGLAPGSAEITLHRALPGRPPVRYLVRLWFADGDARAVVRFRADGE